MSLGGGGGDPVLEATPSVEVRGDAQYEPLKKGLVHDQHVLPSDKLDRERVEGYAREE